MNEAAGMPPMFCPQCGGAVDADARFCKHCAFNLTRTSYPPGATVVTAEGAQPSAPKPVLLIVSVVCVCMLALGLAVAYLYKRNRTRPDATNNAAATAPALVMSERAKQVEEKILRGETLSDKDIQGLSADELRVLRNVHFARYGRKYDRPGLGDYYSTRPWYQPSDSYSDTMITANDKANVNLILAAENQLKQAESTALANANTTNTSQTTTNLVANNNNQPETTGTTSPASALTTSNVQRAVGSFMRDFTKGGQIIVEGVQELPNENAATADLRFVNWVCSTAYDGGLSKQTPPPVTYDRFGMPSSTFGLRLRTYNTSGLAVLKRYNDGRWVLKEVRVGRGFNTITIGGTHEVR